MLKHNVSKFANIMFGSDSSTFPDKIINVLEEIKDDKGSNFLSLQTNKGIIKLLFDDEKQSIIFVSTISNLLQIHNSCKIMESRKL